MRIYITGATGYLGLNLLKTMLENDIYEEIRVLIQNEENKRKLIENLLSGSAGLLKSRLNRLSYQVGSLPYVRLDLTGMECVIHAAAVRGVKASRNRAKELIDVNIFGTRNVVEDIVKYKCHKVMFISSQSVYLNNPDVPWKETTELAPAELYSATKYAGEILIKELEKTSTKYCILRPSHIYGSGLGMRKDELESVFSRRAIEGKPLNIFGDGKKKLDFCHLKDIIDFIINVINCNESESWNQIYNIGQGNPISIYDLACLYVKMAEELNLDEVKVNFTKPEQKDLYPQLWLDITKAKQTFNWKPKILLEEGLIEIINNELQVK